MYVLDKTQTKEAWSCWYSYLRIEPFWFAFDRHQKVVKVHDAVNTKIDSTKDDPHWLLIDPTVPTEQEDSDMMVPMKEHELFLVNHNEECVE